MSPESAQESNPYSETAKVRSVTTPLGEAQPTTVRYGVLALACGLSMITYLDRACFGAAAPKLAEDLSLGGVKDMGIAFTAFSIAYAAFEIPAGWLGDRWGPRGTLIRIVIWWSVCTALTAIVGLKVGAMTIGGLGLLVVLRFLFGAGEAGAYPNIARVLHNWFPSHQWETVQGMIWMSGRLAGGITPLVWAILVSGLGDMPPLVSSWRWAFVVFGVIGLLWCAAFAWVFRNHPHEHPGVNAAEANFIGHAEDSGSHSHAMPWMALFTNRSVMALCLMYSLVNYGWIFNLTYLVGYLKERFAVADNDITGAILKGSPLWVGALGCVVGALLVNLVAKSVGDRRRGRQIVGFFAMLMCAGCWVGAQYANSLYLFCMFISLAAFGVDMTLGAVWATCQDIGGKYTGVTAAYMNTVGTLGSALASWLTGEMVKWNVAATATKEGLTVAELSKDVARQASLDGYQNVFMTYAAVYLVAAVCWLLIDASKKIGRSESPKTVNT